MAFLELLKEPTKMIVDNIDLNALAPITKCFIMIPGTTMVED